MRILLLCLPLLVACQRAHLNVRTEYIDQSYLASSQIDSPNLTCPCLCGEQLVIKYRRLCVPGHLSLSVRFADHAVAHYTRHVSSSSGYWVFRLANRVYECRGPILGYKVELYEGEKCIATFSHLWADPII